MQVLFTEIAVVLVLTYVQVCHLDLSDIMIECQLPCQHSLSDALVRLTWFYIRQLCKCWTCYCKLACTQLAAELGAKSDGRQPAMVN